MLCFSFCDLHNTEQNRNSYLEEAVVKCDLFVLFCFCCCFGQSDFDLVIKMKLNSKLKRRNGQDGSWYDLEDLVHPVAEKTPYTRVLLHFIFTWLYSFPVRFSVNFIMCLLLPWGTNNSTRPPVCLKTWNGAWKLWEGASVKRLWLPFRATIHLISLVTSPLWALSSPFIKHRECLCARKGPDIPLEAVI